MTNVPESCATPSVSYEEGKLLFSSETEGASYHYSIVCDDDCSTVYSGDGVVSLTAAYKISVYASAEGYANSVTATATLYLLNAKVEETTSVIVASDKRGVVVTTNGSTVTISGLEDGESVEAYSLGGVKLGAATARYGSATVSVGGASGVAIIRLGDQSIKVKL